MEPSTNRQSDERAGAVDMLRTVATFTEPWEAHLFRTLLQSEGLFAVVAFDQHVSAHYSIGWAIGAVRVQVVESEFDQARAIERRSRTGEYSTALEAEFGPEGPLHCPHCNSTHCRTSRKQFYLLPLLFLLFGVVAPVRGRTGSCDDCGKKWVA